MSDDKLKPPKYQMNKFDAIMVIVTMTILLAFLAYVLRGG